MTASWSHSSSAASSHRATTDDHTSNRTEERLRIALDAARLGTWEYDLTTNRWQLDDHAQVLYGLPATLTHDNEGLKGVLADEDIARMWECVRAASDPVSGGHYECEYRVRRPDGGARWLAAWGQVEFEGEGEARRAVRIVGASRDVTDQKHAEAERESLMHALREEDRRKDEFLAVLSHELRNPLMPIRNGVYLLEHTPAGSEAARRALEVIGRQVQQITRLIDDLLDVTRITRGKITLHRAPLELSSLVRSTGEDHRELFERGGVSFRVEDAGESLMVNGDPVRLAQIIGNLLHNAAKFTPSGGRATLSVRREGETALVRVADTGAGLPPDMLEQVFKPFIQAQQTLDRTRGGLGLGLALVKGLVEMHGGTVTAASDGAGQGATFTIALPLVTAPAHATKTQPAGVEPETSRRRVLVIEDNPDAADSIREVLELHDHVVAVEYSGTAGVETARRFLPDVVLCDIGLPGLDGYSVARRMRADAALRSALLVAVSGYALEEDVRKCRDAGFDAHIAKPPSVEELQNVLARAPGGDGAAGE